MTDTNTATLGADANLKGQNQEVKTYTEDEFNSKLESETDRRVTEALNTARGKWEKEYNQKMEEAKKDAERRAKLSADEKAREDFQKERDAFEKEKQALYRDKLEVNTRKNLRDEGLNEDFATFLMGNDEETTKENIKIFKSDFDEKVKEEVERRLKGTAPKTGVTNTEGQQIGGLSDIAKAARLIK